MCVYLYITNNVIGFVSKWQTPEFMAIFMRQWSCLIIVQAKKHPQTYMNPGDPRPKE